MSMQCSATEQITLCKGQVSWQALSVVFVASVTLSDRSKSRIDDRAAAYNVHVLFSDSTVPRYYFDVRDGQFVRDNIGNELADLEAARITAMSILHELEPHFPSSGAFSEQEVIVRGSDDRQLLKVILTYKCVELV